ncbi:MAG: TIM barrel protein [Rhodobacteraceae bacterium]|nr:TIM barrel protein [Paracoccaceae bacterium]
MKKETAVDLANDMLKRLIPEAEQRGVRLGIENREALEEIPLDTDFPQLFKKFPSPVAGYWHDCGHAQIKENMGFIQHAMQLEAMAPRLYGFHIHDVQAPARDHCPPGSGMINYTALQPFVRPEHIKVLELSPGVPPAEVLRGFEHIKSLWGPE